MNTHKHLYQGTILTHTTKLKVIDRNIGGASAPSASPGSYAYVYIPHSHSQTFAACQRVFRVTGTFPPASLAT